MAAGTVQTLLVCATDGTVAHVLCPAGTNLKAIEGYVIDVAAHPFFDELLLTGVFDSAAMEFGFSGVLTLFIAGLSVGVVVSMIRKAK